MSTTDTLSDQLSHLRYLQSQPDIDPDVRRIAQDRKNAISELIEYVRSSTGREQYLDDYIAREADRYRDRERLDRLCTCPSPMCGFKSGYLPPEAERDDARSRVRRLHGDAVVFREALSSWQSLYGRLSAEVERIIGLLEANDAAVADDYPDPPTL